MGSRWADAGRAIALLLMVWTTLASGRWIQPLLGAEAALFVSFGVATLLVSTCRERSEAVVGVPASPLGLVVGFAGFAFWLALVATIGLALGLPPAPERQPSGAHPLVLASTLVLGPLFEELLYRERLLPALRHGAGAPVAVMFSSACFALPHIEPWRIVGTFAVGLFLGVVLLWTGSIALCIAIHAGLNLAAAVHGVPPEGWHLPWHWSGAVSLGLLGLSARWLRRSSLPVSG